MEYESGMETSVEAEHIIFEFKCMCMCMCKCMLCSVVRFTVITFSYYCSFCLFACFRVTASRPGATVVINSDEGGRGKKQDMQGLRKFGM